MFAVVNSKVELDNQNEISHIVNQRENNAEEHHRSSDSGKLPPAKVVHPCVTHYSFHFEMSTTFTIRCKIRTKHMRHTIIGF